MTTYNSATLVTLGGCAPQYRTPQVRWAGQAGGACECRGRCWQALRRCWRGGGAARQRPTAASAQPAPLLSRECWHTEGARSGRLDLACVSRPGQQCRGLRHRACCPPPARFALPHACPLRVCVCLCVCVRSSPSARPTFSPPTHPSALTTPSTTPPPPTAPSLCLLVRRTCPSCAQVVPKLQRSA